MTTVDTDPTKLTVNVTPHAMAALAEAAEKTGLSRTDSANRAFTVYNLIVNTPPGEGFAFEQADGTWLHIHVSAADVPA